jgi:hypothetical protein
MRNRLTLDSRAVPGLAPPRPVAAEPLRPGPGALRPPPEPDTLTRTACDAERVMLAGGDMWSLTLHPLVVPFEQLYRRLPEEGMFDPSVSPSRPFAFELGAFRCPERMVLAIYDLRPDIYRFSGIDPGDFVPVEARRFSSILGFQVLVDAKNNGNVLFELDPVAIQTTSLQAFAPPPGQRQPQASFNIAAANSFANVAGAGLSLMPQRPRGYGPEGMPFTLFARPGEVVQVRCVIFRPIPSPIAFIEYDIGGFLFPEKWIDTVLRCIEPTRLERR